MISRSIALQAVFLCFVSSLGACGGSQASETPVVVSPPVVVPPVVVSPVVVPDTSSGKPTVAPEVRILVIGQSISSNCNEKIYGPSAGVFQIGLTGEIKPASDPFEWADCKQGSMWMPLGKLLIESGFASKVTVMPIGIGGTSVADWQEGGKAYAKLNSAVKVIQQRGITFDYAFWHQGSADFGTGEATYKERLQAVIANVGKNVTIKKWLIAIHSRCAGTWDRAIEATQFSVSKNPGDNIFLGPDNNSLDNTYRFDACHLNSRGQEEMARLWLASMNAAQ